MSRWLWKSELIFLRMAYFGSVAATSVQRCVCVDGESKPGVVGLWRRRLLQTPKFQDVKAYLRLHLSAPLRKTLTARHSSQATRLSEEVRWRWPVLAWQRAQVTAACLLTPTAAITAVCRVSYVDLSKSCSCQRRVVTTVVLRWHNVGWIKTRLFRLRSHCKGLDLYSD